MTANRSTQEFAAFTIAAALEQATRRLMQAGIAAPRRDARLLIAQALGAGTELLLGFPERELSDDEDARIAELVAQRTLRKPMAQILGRREFWNSTFAVTADTLDPRPDSECVVEAVLAHVPDRSAYLSLLDLGTGTGCLLLALLGEFPNARGLGIDISKPACEIARRNARDMAFQSRAEFAVGDWGRAVSGRFDVIVSNPPYIPKNEIRFLEPEVAGHEPRLALDGGADGLDAYRALAPDVARLLVDEGIAAVEIGAGQEAAVCGLFEAAGLNRISQHRDLAGHWRCLVFHKGR